MIINRLLFAVFLASHAVAIDRSLNKPVDEAQVEENHGPLRGGRYTNKETIIAPEAEIPERKNVDHVRTLSFGGEIEKGDAEYFQQLALHFTISRDQMCPASVVLCFSTKGTGADWSLKNFTL